MTHLWCSGCGELVMRAKWKTAPTGDGLRHWNWRETKWCGPPGDARDVKRPGCHGDSTRTGRRCRDKPCRHSDPPGFCGRHYAAMNMQGREWR